MEMLTKIITFGIQSVRDAAVLPEARLFILLPVEGLNVIPTPTMSISSTLTWLA